MENHKIFEMSFSSVYPHYIKKAEKKGRKKGEVDEIIYWLTGYNESQLNMQIDKNVSFRTFFDEAPCLNESRVLIKGVVCGIRVEGLEPGLMQEIRFLDKLVDELAKGKKMDKILRNNI